MTINGSIEGMIRVFDNAVMYNVHDGIISYKVKSVGKQAVKDAIFLKEGYGIEVNGSLYDDTVLSEYSLIDIIRVKGDFNEDAGSTSSES